MQERQIAAPAGRYVPYGLSASSLRNIFASSPALSNYHLDAINYRAYRSEHVTNWTIPMTYCYAHIKICVNDLRSLNKQNTVLVSIGESMSMYLPNTMVIIDELDARRMYMTNILKYVTDFEALYQTRNVTGYNYDACTAYTGDLTAIIPGPIPADITTDLAGFNTWLRLRLIAALNEGILVEEERLRADYSMADCMVTANIRIRTGDNASITGLMGLCYYLNVFFALGLIQNRRTLSIELLSTSLIAYLKAGNATAQYIDKIATGMEAIVGTRPTILESEVRATSNTFSGFITSDIMRSVIERFLQNVPPEALQVRLMIDQCKWHGLTVYKTCYDAIDKYRDFYWTRLQRIPVYNLEMENFRIAYNDVGDDEYYGFNRDLGTARSTLFKNFGSVCRQLIAVCESITTTMQSRSFPNNFAERDLILTWITAYNAGRTNREGIDQLADDGVFVRNFFPDHRVPAAQH